MSPTDRYRRPADLPPRIPVFPLRGAILLPRATLPLNVFEPRYLEMLDDVMAGDRLIGIIQPAISDTAEDEESPRGPVGLRSVGCVGRVTSYQEVDHARRMITLTGVARYDVLDEAVTDLPYRVMSVSYDRYATDLSEGLGEEQVDRTNLLRVLRSYLDANKLEADWAAIQRASSEFLINALCVMCPYGPEEKQALLEAEDLKCRADVLVALAEMELASSGSSGTTLQ
ncbi:MAG: LON peptidase substrate-binding domain-containing protein [Hyphomicrobium sp.]|uniref:LON peptidase substrate-binding domain-containing protein n=1 Tax=Hyphomicrobium sp. TaxID=82 RepID=UPI001324A891|nr:LON peptidase substrate-binding domain-containing protein [Hyphomicrobium sp.]KAB2941614.1 MAG: peptidase S16 [Hyphomicrobium sp.]MBZ0210188.1 LON peptidase substrate-binding domain-containing protein [Hyphomicrobium sp.]MCZ7594436.1 LON peptidase substrate-binding domain-containing protein [Hyphomicrobium sp.]